MTSARTVRHFTSSQPLFPLAHSLSVVTPSICQARCTRELSSLMTTGTAGSSRTTRLTPGRTRRGRRIQVDSTKMTSRGYATSQASLKRAEEEEVQPDQPVDRRSQEALEPTSTRAEQSTEDVNALPSSLRMNSSTSSSETTDESGDHPRPQQPQGLVRPKISASHVPFLAPSPLNQAVPPYPPIATSVIREAIADFLSAEKSNHVVPVPQEVYDKNSYFGWRVFYWRTKQLFKFYWAGCKALRSNYMDMRALQRGVKREGWELTRREIRFISRTQADLWKIVPFVFFLMTLEEILPLMVLYTPWLLPSTTILPSQFLRIKSAEEIKRREALLKVGKELNAADNSLVVSAPTPSTSTPVLNSLSPDTVSGLCRALDLGTAAPMFWLRRRLANRIECVPRRSQTLAVSWYANYDYVLRNKVISSSMIRICDNRCPSSRSR
jgi:hypothetical protein